MKAAGIDIGVPVGTRIAYGVMVGGSILKNKGTARSCSCCNIRRSSG